MLGLLAVRRGGLSPGALRDVISASDDVLGGRNTPGTVFFWYGEPPMRRCQPLVFTRLRGALRGCVGPRAGPLGSEVLAFSHRAFWEAAERRYLRGEGERARLLGVLADLFSDTLAERFPGRGISRHVREVEVRKEALAYEGQGALVWDVRDPP